MVRGRRWLGQILVGGLLLAVAGQVAAAQWQVELFSGWVENKDEDLRIKQDGHEDIVLDDTPLHTKPFKMPIFYGLRVARWEGGSGWEVEHSHQKLYVADSDLPDNVQNFEITDGYNLFFLNRAWRDKESGWRWRLGLGPVVVHPDIKVRGETNYVRGGGAVPLILHKGYHWAGAVAQAGLGKRFDFTRHWYGLLGARITHAWADVPIKNGSVIVKNTAAHANFGLGYEF